MVRHQHGIMRRLSVLQQDDQKKKMVYLQSGTSVSTPQAVRAIPEETINEHVNAT